MVAPLRLLELIFDDVLVDMIVGYTKLYSHREKADISFKITNEKICSFLSMLQLNMYITTTFGTTETWLLQTMGCQKHRNTVSNDHKVVVMYKFSKRVSLSNLQKLYKVSRSGNALHEVCKIFKQLYKVGRICQQLYEVCRIHQQLYEVLGTHQQLL